MRIRGCIKYIGLICDTDMPCIMVNSEQPKTGINILARNLWDRFIFVKNRVLYCGVQAQDKCRTILDLSSNEYTYAYNPILGQPVPFISIDGKIGEIVFESGNRAKSITYL